MKLRDYQRDAVRATLFFLKKSKGNPIVALPTGTGKSLIIAALIRYFVEVQHKNVLVLTHVKELIKQNQKALNTFWPNCDSGIYSAGLNKRDTGKQILFAGIGSVHRNTDLFNQYDICLIDECHLVSDSKDTMYRKFLEHMLNLKPTFRVIGLSATPYRLNSGLLTRGGVFTDFSYDATSLRKFNWFIANGYLSTLVAQETKLQLDVHKVAVRGGDFVQRELQQVVDKSAITEQAVTEMLERGKERKHWLIFTTGIDHSKHVAEVLNERGVPATTVDHKCTAQERSDRLCAFTSGEYRALVNTNILTTGFDFPGIDLIGVLRPMCSPGLWVQALGRGTRIAENKTNCLVLDYAGNTRRLGPINDVRLPQRRSNGVHKGQTNVKKCPQCGALHHVATLRCNACDYVFPVMTSKIKGTAAQDALLAKSERRVDRLKVTSVGYNKHTKIQHSGYAIPTLKVTYYCAGQPYFLWLCFEHRGYARKKAREWWRENIGDKQPPFTVDEALSRSVFCRKPKSIEVDRSSKYPEIVKVHY